MAAELPRHSRRRSLRRKGESAQPRQIHSRSELDARCDGREDSAARGSQDAALDAGMDVRKDIAIAVTLCDSGFDGSAAQQMLSAGNLSEGASSEGVSPGYILDLMVPGPDGELWD